MNYSTADIVTIATGTVFLTLVIILNHLAGDAPGVMLGVLAFGLAYLVNITVGTIVDRPLYQVSFFAKAFVALGSVVCVILTVAAAVCAVI